MTAAEVDVQTGAYARAHFESLLAEAARAARRAKAPLALLWVDLDELTEANDTWGREAVDAAIAALAETLAAVLDGRGPIGRVRGGAFAALLPGVTAAQALALAEALRARRGAAGDPDLRVSCGVAQLRGDEPWGNLLEAAEAACTRAKQGGGDLVARR